MHDTECIRNFEANFEDDYFCVTFDRSSLEQQFGWRFGRYLKLT